LRVATSGDYPPFSLADAQGELSGFDINVARRLAEDLGRPLQLERFKWTELNDRLRSGAIDLVMSGVTVRGDRALLAVYSRPYVDTGAVAVLRAADAARFSKLESLDQPALRIAVNGGGHLEKVARHQFPRARLMIASTNLALADLLRQHAVQAVISEPLEVRAWGEGFVMLGPFTHDRKAYVAPRGKADLLERVDAWLAQREADGWLEQQRRQWLGDTAHWDIAKACTEALVSRIDLRLQMMPWVAAAKRRDNLPVRDERQEAAVLQHVRERAQQLQLQPETVAALFQVLIDVARAVQQDATAAATLLDGIELADLRSAVAAISEQLLAELQRCAASLGAPQAQPLLAAALQRDLKIPGLPADGALRLSSTLAAVRRAP
jgi:cyclohexadienyl dehydratase